MLGPALIAFAVSALLCGAAFLASLASEGVLCLPDLPSWPAARQRAAHRTEPASPVFCPASQRWRDPVSRRFVRKPA